MTKEHNSKLTFLKGDRYYKADESSYSIKRNIMWKEYSSYLDMYKSNSQSVTRARTMVLIHDMYLQMEQFTFKEAPFIILTVQSSEAFTKKPKNEQMTILKQHLPPIIIDNIVEDITGTLE